MRSVRQAVNRPGGPAIRCGSSQSGPRSRPGAQAEELSQRWRRGGERGFSMALSRFAAIEDADCLIVQARNLQW